jgi:hypothetical protein
MDVVFISGHTNLSNDEFELHYKPALNRLTSEMIYIGNAYGADKMSFDYLISKGYQTALITICCYGKSSVDPDYYKTKNVHVIEGFNSYTQRDTFMTNNSVRDLLWIRPEEETRRLVEAEGKTYSKRRVSGTELNKIRRGNPRFPLNPLLTPPPSSPSPLRPSPIER